MTVDSATIWQAAGAVATVGATGITVFWRWWVGQNNAALAREAARETRDQARLDRMEAVLATERQERQTHAERLRGEQRADTQALTAALTRATDMGARSSEVLERLEDLLIARDSETSATLPPRQRSRTPK